MQYKSTSCTYYLKTILSTSITFTPCIMPFTHRSKQHVLGVGISTKSQTQNYSSTVTPRTRRPARTPTHPPKQKVCTKAKNKLLPLRSPTKIEVIATKMKCKSGVGKSDTSVMWRDTDQCFSTCVTPRPGKFFFHKTRARSQQIYS